MKTNLDNNKKIDFFTFTRYTHTPTHHDRGVVPIYASGSSLKQVDVCQESTMHRRGKKNITVNGS